MKSPIKFRWILLAIIVVSLFSAVNNSLKRSDYRHCTVTSKMTSEQCQSVTGYVINK